LKALISKILSLIKILSLNRLTEKKCWERRERWRKKMEKEEREEFERDYM
jgi:hypothetical protein